MADIAFHFVPDDGTQPQLIEITDTLILRELGEYARGIKNGSGFIVRILRVRWGRKEHRQQSYAASICLRSYRVSGWAHRLAGFLRI